MPNMPQSVYKENTSMYTKAIAGNQQWLSVLSWLRLLFFLGFGWFLYRAFAGRFSGNELLISLTSLLLFLVLVFWSHSFQQKKKILRQLVLINENEIALAEGRPSRWDNGTAFGVKNGFAADLPLFGNHSLYHLLNRAGSFEGRKKMSERLLNPILNPERIRTYQACSIELAADTAFRQQLLAHTLLLEEGDAAAQIQTEIPEAIFMVLQNTFWSILSIVWPLTGFSLLIYSVVTDNYRYLLLFGITGLLLLSFVFKKVGLLYAHISKRSYLFQQYGNIFRLISTQPVHHPYLVQQQTQISKAVTAFRKLSRLTGVFDLRLSLFSIFLNGLFLSDLLMARAYLKWNQQYQSLTKQWFSILGEWEFLHSIATYQYNHPAFVFPAITEEPNGILADAMGHPLMEEGKAVVNDISIGNHERLHLITGSNMSGKSTFLRALGLNMVLAQMGAPVFARSFRCSPMELLTSFHHIDSLEESTSYFYAELKCLQNIIATLANGKPALVLLDEVMRGTNSTDKHDGTALLIKKILGYRCLCLIATHDIALGELADQYPGEMANFCFESEITDKGLHFDFSIRNGVARSKNATYLMQQMGII